jgi:predicted RNA-binding protein with RPS1 domain
LEGEAAAFKAADAAEAVNSAHAASDDDMLDEVPPWVDEQARKEEHQMNLMKIRTFRRPPRKRPDPKRPDPKRLDPSVAMIGETRKGTVKSLTNYGAFIDLGLSFDGLCHISNIAAKFVSSIEDVIMPGDKVEARITSVDVAKRQIGLSLLTLEEEAEMKAKSQERPEKTRGGGGGPSGASKPNKRKILDDLVAVGYDDAQFVDGIVTTTASFGAFVRFDVSALAPSLSGELEGLVHISSITAKDRVENVSDVVKEGDSVRVRVKMIAQRDGRIGLSMISKEDDKSTAGRKEWKPRERKEDGTEPRYSDMGDPDWEANLAEYNAEQNPFTNNILFYERGAVETEESLQGPDWYKEWVAEEAKEFKATRAAAKELKRKEEEEAAAAAKAKEEEAAALKATLEEDAPSLNAANEEEITDAADDNAIDKTAVASEEPAVASDESVTASGEPADASDETEPPAAAPTE